MYDQMKSMAIKTMPETDGGVVDQHEPIYPFNLSITLDNDQIEAIGLDCDHEDCQVGNYLHLHMLVEVKGIHRTENGVSLNLQCTHACAENESSEDQEYDEEYQGRSVYGG